MMRSFLSPAEMLLLAELTPQEATLVRELMDELSAHLVEEDEKPAEWMRNSVPRDGYREVAA